MFDNSQKKTFFGLVASVPAFGLAIFLQLYEVSWACQSSLYIPSAMIFAFSALDYLLVLGSSSGTLPKAEIFLFRVIGPIWLIFGGLVLKPPMAVEYVIIIFLIGFSFYLMWRVAKISGLSLVWLILVLATIFFCTNLAVIKKSMIFGFCTVVALVVIIPIRNISITLFN